MSRPDGDGGGASAAGGATDPTRGSGRPWLTIVTVVRNDREALNRTIDSVAAQEVSLLEQLIIDGASTDGTAEVAQAAAEVQPWLRVVSEPDAGIYDAMNKGLSLARGDFILYLNAGDDFHTDGEVAAIHSAWQDSGFEWGRFRCRHVDSERNPTRPLEDAGLDQRAFLAGRQPTFHQGAVMSRAMLTNLGGFDTSYLISGDFDLMRRALVAGYQPWISERVISDFDAGGISTLAWRKALAEEHRSRSTGATGSARARSWLSTAGRYANVGARRTLRRGAELVLGADRVSRLRS